MKLILTATLLTLMSIKLYALAPAGISTEHIRTYQQAHAKVTLEEFRAQILAQIQNIHQISDPSEQENAAAELTDSLWTSFRRFNQDQQWYRTYLSFLFDIDFAYHGMEHRLFELVSDEQQAKLVRQLFDLAFGPYFFDEAWEFQLYQDILRQHLSAEDFRTHAERLHKNIWQEEIEEWVYSRDMRIEDIRKAFEVMFQGMSSSSEDAQDEYQPQFLWNFLSTNSQTRSLMRLERIAFSKNPKIHPMAKTLAEPWVAHRNPSIFRKDDLSTFFLSDPSKEQKTNEFWSFLINSNALIHQGTDIYTVNHAYEPTQEQTETLDSMNLDTKTFAGEELFWEWLREYPKFDLGFFSAGPRLYYAIPVDNDLWEKRLLAWQLDIRTAEDKELWLRALVNWARKPNLRTAIGYDGQMIPYEIYRLGVHDSNVLRARLLDFLDTISWLILPSEPHLIKLLSQGLAATFQSYGQIPQEVQESLTMQIADLALQSIQQVTGHNSHIDSLEILLKSEKLDPAVQAALKARLESQLGTILNTLPATDNRRDPLDSLVDLYGLELETSA